MHDFIDDIKTLDTTNLRKKWSEMWDLPPPSWISRKMLEKSLAFKMREQAGLGLTRDQQKRLDALVHAYKRKPRPLKQINIKPGTRLVRTFRGVRYQVTVCQNGFDYNGITYNSLSEIAKLITNASWNGWVFFGLKKAVVPKQEAA